MVFKKFFNLIKISPVLFVAWLVNDFESMIFQIRTI